MACLLLWARDTAAAARRAGQARLDPAFADDLAGCYQAAAAEGITVNLFRHGTAPREGRALARRFQRYQDDILRFVTRPGLDIFTNNEAERTIRPVKVQQRASGGCWRTLQGLADFAIVQSYLSTATRWGISKIDALRALFQGHPWIPPGLAPAG
jgi:transposase